MGNTYPSLWDDLGNTALMKGVWVVQMALKDPCNLRTQCSRRSAWKSGIGSLTKYSQLFEMEMRLLQFRDPMKANLQGAGDCAAACFKWQLKEGSVPFPGWGRISLSPFPSLLSTCWLGVVSPKQSDGGVPRAWPLVPAAPPSMPHDGLSLYRWTGDGLKWQSQVRVGRESWFKETARQASFFFCWNNIPLLHGPPGSPFCL